MSEFQSNIQPWVVKELAQLGIQAPKLKKMRQQIQKKNLKGKQCGVFGVGLSKLSSEVVSDPVEFGHSVPCFLDRMTRFLSEHFHHNCIFRKNGHSDRMKHLREILELGEDPPEGTFVEDAAGLLKAWFRDLPVALIPQAYHELFISCLKVCESSSSSKALLLACTLLPKEHLATLKHILNFLAQVAKHSAINKMSAQSLAIVFAPNVMPTLDKNRHDNKSLSIEVLKEKQARECEVVQWLIEHSDEVSNTPASVALLAHLAARTPTCANKKEQVRKTKRRKSMCDIVGVKIKKMVGPHSNVAPPEQNKSAKRNNKRSGEMVSDTADSSKKRSKRKPKDAQPDIEHETPSRVLTNKMDQLNILAVDNLPLKSQKATKTRMSKANCSPCYSGSSPECAEYINVPKDVEPEHANLPINRNNSDQGENCLSTEKPKADIDSLLQTKIDESEKGHNEEGLCQVSEKICTPTKTELLNSGRPKSSLRRGRPNTLTSGLKTGKRGHTRRNSLEMSTPCSEFKQLSKRRSRSTSSIYVPNSSNDHNLEKEASTSIQRILNFTDGDKEERLSGFGHFQSPVHFSDDLMGTSLGFSPILHNSKDSPKFSIDSGEWLSMNSNPSHNPFGDHMIESDIPTLNSSIGDNSIFSKLDEPAGNDDINGSSHSGNLSEQEHFVAPSPIVNRKESKNLKGKLSITASSTPANKGSKFSWQCAQSFDFDEKIPADDVDGTKRESIVKLRQTNAGKVLANINLYDNKFVPKSSVSPAGVKATLFERNGIATKSVRERSKNFFSEQGFKVPSGCPRSIRRVAKNPKNVRNGRHQTLQLASPISEPEFQSGENEIVDASSLALKNPKHDFGSTKQSILDGKSPLRPALCQSKMLF